MRRRRTTPKRGRGAVDGKYRQEQTDEELIRSMKGLPNAPQSIEEGEALKKELRERAAALERQIKEMEEETKEL